MWTDGMRDMKRLIIDFRNFETADKKDEWLKEDIACN